MKILLVSFLLLLSLTTFAQTVPSPESFFGFKPGTDRMLFTYEQLIDYLKLVEKNSNKMRLFEIGKSPMAKPMFIACISSADNLKNIDRLKEINYRLALETTLSPTEKQKLVKEGKVFVLSTMSMHSGEVGPSQSVPLITYDWVTSADSLLLKALNDVVYMIVPCHNPDGMDMVVNYYNETKGTKYEGSPLPGVYHKYVGHDNNRDFIFLTQSDTKAISALTSTDWFPQVMVEKHQMSALDPRYFVPPNHDPIAENVDAELFIWTGVFGQNMINDMTKEGLKGISQHTLFDNYWPGSTETCIWKNVIAMLTEGASCQIAKPVYVEPTELIGYGKGLAEYKKSINMPEPWPGGWWRLGDIVQYEVTSSLSILKTASLHKEQILNFRNDMCRKEVNKGLTQAPYYFILPQKQSDASELVSLVGLLQEHGVNIYKLERDISIETQTWKAGDIVIPLAQPFRAFIKEVMEKQKYPERHYTPGGELIDPYDITTWSLPLHKGLISVEIDTRNSELEKAISPVASNYSLALPKKESPFIIFPSTENESYRLAFEALAKGFEVKRCGKSFDYQGTAIPSGSFLMAHKAALDEILSTVTFPLVYADKEPEVPWEPVRMPRIALVESWFNDLDAGWTRYLLDTYHVGYSVVRPGEVTKTGIRKKFDLILFPDQDASVLKDGKYKEQDKYFITDYKPEFTKGIGPKGLDSLVRFLNGGGKIICWGRSTGLFEGNLSLKSKSDTEEFRLPYRSDLTKPELKGLNCPGSLIRVNLLKDHPLTYGMNAETGIFYRGRPIFSTNIPQFDMDRRVIGWFGEENLLLSGFLAGEKNLFNKPVMLWIKKNKGQMVLMGFSPVFRASMPATYKLLFNSILLPDLK